MDGPALLVVLLYLLQPILVTGDEDGLTLRVGEGLLRGHLLASRKGRQFRAFHGVPYAKPPLGELRFKAPEPAEPWVGVRNATRYSDICTQRSIFAKQENVAGSEDCLYLNIFTPSQDTLKNLDRLLDVMVWIHGGGFVSGAGSFYTPNFLLDHDIVLVTINYRLGPLGFLSTGDAQAPGNFGLKDQVAALRWVKENAAMFGGDPARITAFGESAGGASVHFHTISPLSVGLMARGISQSGTALCPWTLTSLNHSVAQTRKLAKLLDCPPADPLPCLRVKDAVDIIATDRQFMEWDVDPLIPFKPVVEPKEVDGAFLPADPLELLLDKSRKKIPWLTGINSGDGALKAAPIYERSELVKELNEQFERVAPITLMYEQSGAVLEVTQRIRDFYFQQQPISNETLKHVVDMYTDWFFLSAAHAAVRAHLLSSDPEEAPLYYYYFAYRGRRSYSEVFGDPTRDFGVCHADELLYMFPSTKVFANFTPSQEEHDMTDLLTRLWVNFAHTGNPTPEGEKIHWLKTSSPYKPEYLHIASPYDVHMKSGLLVERAEFWSALPLTATQYPQLISLHDEL